MVTYGVRMVEPHTGAVRVDLLLDETALGRQEEWEEPKGRADDVRGAIPDFAR